MYKATLSVLGRKYQAEGTTAQEAVANLKPTNVKGKGILSIEHGKDKREKILMPHIASRLFNTVGLNREVALKNISLLFAGL